MGIYAIFLGILDFPDFFVLYCESHVAQKLIHSFLSRTCTFLKILFLMCYFSSSPYFPLFSFCFVCFINIKSGPTTTSTNNQQHYEETKNSGLSSSSDEFSSPVPNQINPNHQFSPTNHLINNPNNPQRRYVGQMGQRVRGSGVNSDPLGNIFILPRQLDVGLCQGCRNVYGTQESDQYVRHHQNVSKVGKYGSFESSDTIIEKCG